MNACYPTFISDPFACTCHLIAAANQAKAAAAAAAAAAQSASGSSTAPSAPPAPPTSSVGRQRHASGQPAAVPAIMGSLHWTSSESTLVPTEVVRQQQRMIHYHHHLRAAADQVANASQ